MNLWPNTLYRYTEEGEREGRTFKRPEDVPAGEGWVSVDDLGPAPVAPKKPAPMPSADAADAGKRLVRAESENARLKDSVKYLEDQNGLLEKELAATRKALEAAEALIGEGAEEAPEEKPKPRRKPRSS